ncbi:MAG TPA: MFS transporter [Candidatus Aquabacterium excrementipullorum]|nr:MFS transporter [Candidatus Aquabacterium excrementipullorum]
MAMINSVAAAEVWPPRQSGRLAARSAFWLLASLVLVFLAASSAPSPLYGLYRETMGFSALTLTLVFSVYAFALLGGLLVFGALSDHVGRRPVLLAALVLELGALILFHQADSVEWLVAARLVQGLATGIATAVLSAALLDLQQAKGALVNSVAPMFGMAVGALGAAALVHFAPAPTRLVFEVLLVVVALQSWAAIRLPDTVTPRAGAWQSLRPKLAVPAAARKTLWGLLPVNTAQWSLGGFYLSLGPTLVRSVTGSTNPLLGGALIATLVLSGAVGILWLRQRPAPGVLKASAAALAVGLLLTLAGVHAHAVNLLFLGTVLAGLGFGAGFNASVRSLVPLAHAHERGALMASFFVLSYLAFSLPALAAGLAVGHFGIEVTALGYGLVLVLLSGLAGVSMARRQP